MDSMPEIRHELADDQYKELSKIKDRRGLTWKGLLLAGADALEDVEEESNGPDLRQFPGLTYSNDQRVFPDPADDQLGSFKAGWMKAETGETFSYSTLESLSWHNLGWRLGMLFEDASGDLKREVYMWCVDRQQEGAESRITGDGHSPYQWV